MSWFRRRVSINMADSLSAIIEYYKKPFREQFVEEMVKIAREEAERIAENIVRDVRITEKDGKVSFDISFDLAEVSK